MRVLPKNDAIRDAIKHPSGRKFPTTGSVEWPLDGFTRRRLKDGTVTRDESQTPQRAAPKQKTNETAT